MFRVVMILLSIVFAVCKPAYASGPRNYSEFFKDMETIELHVTVTNDEGATSFWYGFDEKEVRPPLSRSEIAASVFKAFREMFSEAGMRITGDETKEERAKLQAEYEKKHPPKPKLPDADPFDMSDYVPPEPRLIVRVYVVLNRYVEKNGSQFIHGAITVNTYRDFGRRHPDSKNLSEKNFSEVFPTIFVLPEEKDKATEMIKESVKRAYQQQGRWILCTKVQGVSCTEDQSEFMEKWRKKYMNNESQLKK